MNLELDRSDANAVWQAVEARADSDREAYLRSLEVSAEIEAVVRRRIVLARLEPSWIADAMALPNSPSHAPQESLLGKSLGNYLVEREIGSGGMGEVYLARHVREDLEQQVAVKVLRPHFADGFSSDRFALEQRILSQFDHPGVAQLYDVGEVLREGTPLSYLVMEYVPGVPLFEYAASRTLREKLALFRQVLEAVRYAHQRLVVHRDLKASNILVNERGEVKLLDFGIAKLLEASDRNLDLTQTGTWVFTPEAAAPEQVTQSLTTIATDIYQLGLLLYRLLSEQPAFALEGKNLWQIAREITETDPKKPSRVCDTADRRRLEGDLDNIVMRCLNRVPEQRYATVEAVLADLDAYANGYPIAARAPSLSYRIGKFAQRNKVASALTVALFVGLIGYAGTLTALNREVTAALATAQEEANKATYVTDFLVDLFERIGPDQRLSREQSIESLLKLGAEQLESAQFPDAATDTQLNYVVGRLHRQLGLYEESLPILRRASSLASDRDDMALQLAAAQELGTSLSRVGRYDHAERVVADAIRSIGDRAEHAKAVGGLYNILGLNLRRRGLPDEAIEHYRTALDALKEGGAEVSREASFAYSNLGVAFYRQGNYAVAASEHRRALRIREQLFGDAHWLTAKSYNNLAASLRETGHLDEAIELHQKALASLLQSVGNLHPYTAATRSDLGAAFQRAGRYADAEFNLDEALKIRIALLGEKSYEVGASYYALAVLDIEREEYAAALEKLDRVAQSWSASHGSDHPYVGDVWARMGDLRRRQGDCAKALDHFDDAMRVLRPDSLSASSVYSGQARCLLDAQPAKAEVLLAKAVAIRAEVMPPDHPRLLELQVLLEEMGSAKTRRSDR